MQTPPYSNTTENPTRPNGQKPYDDPWPVDVTGHDAPPCKCEPPPALQPKPPCTRSRPKEDCCETILQMLDPKQRNESKRKIHKRKMPVKVKLANWCCDWPVTDAIAPIMVLLFDRAKKELAPQNAFEQDIYKFLKSMDKKHRDAFQIGVDAYHAIPEGRRCAFETRFDDWPDDRPVDPDFIAKVVAKELIALGRYGIFAKKDGEASVGEMRLWEPPVVTLPDGNTPAPLLGPWPWICAVNPGADNNEWYRNRDYVVPDKADIISVDFKLHEFSIECKATTDPNNPKSINVDCEDKILSGSFASCDGGVNYAYKAPSAALRCLAIPRCVAGQGVSLRGFNFLSLASTVVVKKVGGGFPDMTLPCDVMGDDNPPSKGASCGIHDVVTFMLPKTIRDGLNDRAVPTGRYSVEIHVPNDSNYAPEPGPAPKEFVSNIALIEVIPPLDIDYQVWVERGNCYEETAGLGDDEPWFRSYTATYRAVGKQVLETASRDIFQQEDIESGDWIGFPPVTPFDGKLERDGVVAIAILGLEVDSDDAAKQHVTNFGDAYELYFKQLLTGAASAGAGGLFGKGLGTLVDKGIVTLSLIVGGIALAAIAVGGLFYAAWAPADPIGYDLLVFDAVTLYNLVTPGGAPRIQGEGNIGGITWSSYPKGFTIKAADVAEYREERQYWSDDEESKYGLDFMITRLP
jgi:hypothetical protein